MTWARVHRRFSAWLALVAILLVALAPTVSHALNASSGAGGQVEVCTIAGPKLVSLQGGETDGPAPGAALAFEHCSYCTLAGHVFALPPAPAAAFDVGPMRLEPPSVLRSAPRRVDVRVAAQPRAPPQSS